MEKDTLHIILQKNPKILIEIYNEKLYHPEYFPIYEQFINKNARLTCNEFKIMIEFIVELFNYNYMNWYQSPLTYDTDISRDTFSTCKILFIIRLLKNENETYLEFLLNNLDKFLDTTNLNFGYSKEPKYRFGLPYQLGDILQFRIYKLESLFHVLKDELETLLISNYIPHKDNKYENLDTISYILLKGLFQSPTKQPFKKSLLREGLAKALL